MRISLKCEGVPWDSPLDASIKAFDITLGVDKEIPIVNIKKEPAQWQNICEGNYVGVEFYRKQTLAGPNYSIKESLAN